MSTSVSDPPGLEPGTDRRPSTPRLKTPSELAYERLWKDDRLSSDAKLVAGVHLDHCLAEDNAGSLASQKRVAEKLGWSKNNDLGVARVKRAESLLIKHGYAFTLPPADYRRWLDSVGRPRLGLRNPRGKGTAHRFVVLTWKRPDASPEDWACPIRRQGMGAGAHPPSPAMGAVDHEGWSTSTIRPWAPAPIPSNGSNSEPGNGTEEEERNVTARPLSEAQIPENTPIPEATVSEFVYTEADVEGWLLDLKSRIAFKRTLALGCLARADRLPPECRDEVPKFDDGPQELRRTVAPAVTKTPAELLEDRIRRVADGPLTSDASTIEELAWDLCHALVDARSEGYYREGLRDMRAGIVTLEQFLIAFRKARKARRGEQGREFVMNLEPYRKRARKKNRPPALSWTRAQAVDPQKTSLTPDNYTVT